MNVLNTSIDGLRLVEPDVYQDARGYFFEEYNRTKYRASGIVGEFVQDNCSYSRHGTVRGLHYQVGDAAQGKLVTVLQGCVLDVAVDIRFGSPTFGKHVAVELTDENHRQLWIPPGFAHGFSVLSETAVFHYKCTAHYSQESERAIVFNDADLNIDWRVAHPIVSQKDLRASRFCTIMEDFVCDPEGDRI